MNLHSRTSVEYNTSMGVQITNGQRYLLDLLQRKLLNTIQAYAKLSLTRSSSSVSSGDQDNEQIDAELCRLKEKIKRISARSKRFTLEIRNGNGNNTIPKESFFEALGLVTRETLNKLNSKTSERRRRTTANPRFSHEAIQAKRALEPLHKRGLDSRASKEKRGEGSRSRGNNQKGQIGTGVDVNNSSSNNGNNNNNNRQSNNQQAFNNKHDDNNTSGCDRATNGRNRNVSLLTEQEQKKLISQLCGLHNEISTKVSHLQKKQESNKKLDQQNELIRKRGLEMIGAINKLHQNGLRLVHSQTGETNLQYVQDISGHINGQSNDQNASLEPYDILLECNESLDGLD